MIWEKRLTRSFALLIALLIGFHSAAVIAFNLPLNALTASVQTSLNHYINPFMFQEWGFFAPIPGGWHDRAYVRYRYYNQSEVIVSPWVEMNSIFASSFQNQIFRPIAIDRSIYYSLLTNVDNDGEALRHLGSVDHGSAVNVETLTDTQQQLLRLAMSLGPAICAVPRTARYQVQISIERSPVKHFAEAFDISRTNADASFRRTLSVRFPWVISEPVPPLGGIDGCGR